MMAKAFWLIMMIAGVAVTSGLDQTSDSQDPDLSRNARASPLRWGKRGSNILRWGKRTHASDDLWDVDDDDLQEQLDLVRNKDDDDDLIMRQLRSSPLRWGKRMLIQDKRAPLRWGKRAPSRFGKRQHEFNLREALVEASPFLPLSYTPSSSFSEM